MEYEEYQHFSHDHDLDLLKLDEGEKINCEACEQQINENFYGCIKCKYYLHENCLDIPRSLDHPSHPSHPLTLHQTPTYTSRSYTCNACGSEGNGFSFCCALCEFDIHIHCSNLPTSVMSEKHPHELQLSFGSSNEENTVLACDICRSPIDPHKWLYYCADCHIGSHLDCVKVKLRKTKEKPKKGKGKSKKAEAEKRAGSSHVKRIEDLNAVREAEEELFQAKLQYKIDAQAREFALDLWTPRRRKHHY